MNPEDTDKFQPFEALVRRLDSAPKDEADDQEKAEAAKKIPSDRSSDEPVIDPRD